MTNEEARVFLDNLKICIEEHPIVADWLVEIANRKTEPQTETIRCKDCIHWQDSKSFCGQFHVGTPSDGYCYMAKRMTTGADCSWK